MNNFVAYLVAGHVVSQVDVPSIPVVRDGFWITKEGKFTTKQNNIYWIPPSGVLFVQRYRGFK